MFGIGETELVIIVVFAFLLFGPDKLPGMGRTLGRVLRQFREASDGFTEVVQTNIMDPASEELEKSPKQRSREAAEHLGDDSDTELAEDTAPQPRRETFAERRARLQAEREAQASQPDAFDDEADQGEAERADVDSDDDVEEVVEPARTTAADLYSMSGRKSSRSESTEPGAADHDAPSNAGAQTIGEEGGRADA